MSKLTNRKITIIIAAVLIILAIVAAAITPTALRRAEINTQFEIAMQYLNDLDYESAILAFTKILEIDPKNKTVLEILQDTYLAYIRSEWEKGNTDHAIQIMSDMKNTLSPFGMTEDPYTAEITAEPTCGAVGHEIWTCNLKDDVLERDIPATGAHIWNDGSVTTKATYQNDGVMTYTCSVCQSEKTEVISMLIDEVLVVNDKNLEAALREAINKPTGTLMVSDFANLTLLALENNNISDITPLANLTNLTFLDLSNNNITDISPLAKLTNLTLLDLSNNNITDISPLAKLTNLTYLDLYYNNISDISPLANLTNLTDLNLYYNNISDISPLANLTNLTSLTLASNNISDISPLANLTNLTYLSLTSNNISDISPLANLTNLTSLYLEYNNISDWSPVAHVANVEGRP